jgi:hypothetical protein
VAVAAETDFDGFREVGAVPRRPANDVFAAEWRGRWDEF